MKKLTLAVAIVGALAGASMTTATPAMARDSFAFSFDTGNVRFAYSDGYWDQNRRWHKWRSAREAREFRVRYRDRYYANRSSYYPNRGWRDSDRDGIPNRYDRDRDGDGTPNRFDDRPNNPWRD